MMTVDNVLRLAKLAGVTVLVDGYDLVLEHDAEPPLDLVAMCRRFKPELVSALRMREAEDRRRIVQWVADSFTSSPPGVCAHCGEGAREDDPFVHLFVGTDRGEVHGSCHSAWLAEREAEACEALGLEPRPVALTEASSSIKGPQ